MIYVILAVAIGWIATKMWDGHARWRYFVDRFGEEATRRIQQKEIWQGGTAEMIEQTFGKPLEVKESVLKATTKTPTAISASPRTDSPYESTSKTARSSVGTSDPLSD